MINLETRKPGSNGERESVTHPIHIFVVSWPPDSFLGLIADSSLPPVAKHAMPRERGRALGFCLDQLAATQ
jgi:hypothetical protein